MTLVQYLYSIEAVSYTHLDVYKRQVYPIVGWWRERAYLGKYDSKVRYSMIVSLSTPKIDVDLYTPIVTEIKNAIEIDIEAI